MLNVECEMLNEKSSRRNSFNIQHSTLTIPVLLLALSVSTTGVASELSVDKRSMQMDDSLTITVTLENDYANVDTIRVLLVVCSALQNAQDVLAARLGHIFTTQVPKPSPVRL